MASSRQASQYELAGANAIPTTGVLAEDVILEVSATNSDDITTSASVTVHRADTLTHTSVDELAATVRPP